MRKKITTTLFQILILSLFYNCSSTGKKNDIKEILSELKDTTNLQGKTDTLNTRLLNEYKTALEKLDKNKVKNVRVAMSLFITKFNNQNPATCDEALALFESFHAVLGNTYTNNEPPVFRYENDEKKYVDTLNLYGFCLRSAEGEQYIARNLSKSSLVQKTYPYLTQNMVKYLQQRKQEEDHFFADDGGLVISEEELVERLLWWEIFMDNIKGISGNFPFKYDAQGYYYIYRNLMIKGLENTPVYYTGEGVNPYFKKAYDYLFKRHSESKCATLFKSYYASLEQLDSTAILDFQSTYFDDPKE